MLKLKNLKVFVLAASASPFRDEGDMATSPYDSPTLIKWHKCDRLLHLDWRYAKIVQGVSKMPWDVVWRREQATLGLHEQVGACEAYLVQRLVNDGVIARNNRHGTVANRFRRHDKLFEAFGIAVGALMTTDAPMESIYDRDMQNYHRKQMIDLFAWSLRHNNLTQSDPELDATLDDDEEHYSITYAKITCSPEYVI